MTKGKFAVQEREREEATERGRDCARDLRSTKQHQWGGKEMLLLECVLCKRPMPNTKMHLRLKGNTPDNYHLRFKHWWRKGLASIITEKGITQLSCSLALARDTEWNTANYWCCGLRRLGKVSSPPVLCGGGCAGVGNGSIGSIGSGDRRVVVDEEISGLMNRVSRGLSPPPPFDLRLWQPGHQGTAHHAHVHMGLPP